MYTQVSMGPGSYPISFGLPEPGHSGQNKSPTRSGEIQSGGSAFYGTRATTGLSGGLSGNFSVNPFERSQHEPQLSGQF